MNEGREGQGDRESEGGKVEADAPSLPALCFSIGPHLNGGGKVEGRAAD